MRLAIGITGASGAPYALALLERLRDHSARVELDVVFSPAGHRVWQEELGWPATGDNLLNWWAEGTAGHILNLYDHDDIGAPPASGSIAFDGYLIVPCSAGTLGRVAAGAGENLITRMADVALKERRPLVLLVRETPLSTIHLDNMLRVTQAGGIIMPAAPAFYHHPETIDELVDFLIERVLAHVGLENSRIRYSP